MRKDSSFALICFVLSVFLSTTVMADNWPNWRGPDQNGTATGSGFPVEWSKEKNVAWKYDLPGAGASTPAVWGDKLFLSFTEGNKNVALCLNRNGEKVWQVALDGGVEAKHKKATGANSSPVTNGKHVVFYFKSGDLVSLDVNGNVKWEKNTYEAFGENSMWWDQGTSPVIVKDQVIVTHQQTGPSWIAAYNIDSGEVAWKQDRMLPAPSEAAQSYTTPLVLGKGDSQQLVLAGADHVTGHSLDDGHELWRVGGLNPGQEKFFRSISSPVATDTHVIVPYARGATLTAVRLGGSGDITDTHVDWTKDVSADVPTPAFTGKRVYVLTDKKGIACLNPKTGETIWSSEVEKNRTAFSSSPIVADGKVYLTREDGTTFVIRDGDEFELLSKNELGEMIVATPVLVDGKIYLRTKKTLYCIGTGKSEQGAKKGTAGESVPVSLDALQGTWKVVSVGKNGEFAPAEFIKRANLRMKVKGNKYRVTSGDDKMDGGTFTIDDSTDPVVFDQHGADGSVHLGIVRFRDGKLEHFQGDDGEKRPKDFAKKRTDNASQTVLEREAK